METPVEERKISCYISFSLSGGLCVLILNMNLHLVPTSARSCSLDIILLNPHGQCNISMHTLTISVDQLRVMAASVISNICHPLCGEH